MTSDRPKFALRTAKPQVASSALPEGEVVEAGLAAEEPEAEAESRGLAGRLLAQHLLEKRRIGRRAVDPGHAEILDGFDEQPGVADAEGHDGGAGLPPMIMWSVTPPVHRR